MSAVRFLLDEHVPWWLQPTLWRLDSTVEILCVGDDGAPAGGTKDPRLLAWAEANGFSIVTRDRSTMIDHAREFQESGGKTWGLFVLRDGFPIGRIADDLFLIWSASDVDEWQDQVRYIPFTDG